MTVIIILFLLIIFFLGYDYWEDFFTWLGRIKIGRLSEREWKIKTRKVMLRWIRRGAPEVYINDDKRKNIIAKINDYGRITSVTYWQDAALLKALNSLEGDYSFEMKNLVSKYISEDSGDWKTPPKRVDSAMFCYELLSGKYADKEKIKPAMDYVARTLKTAAETYDTIPYNADIPEYRFVDTIGMVCPFLIKYALIYNAEELIPIAIKQIREYREYGMEKRFNIPFHSFKTQTFEPLGVCGWARGCAWLAVGLTDSLKTLIESGDYGREKGELLKFLIELLNSIAPYIQDDGTVNRMLFSPSAQDSSACAMLAYCYAYISDLTGNESFKALALKMREKLRSVTRRNGVVDFSQGDTHGIGFYSSRLCIVPAAQGFAITVNELLNHR